MSIENRSSSANFKRNEQLKRWAESETNRENTVPKSKSKKIQFPSGVVFLAACAAGEKEEVLRLLKQGVDINTTNVDGLTALHQLCIDDNLDMVEFLVENGADVNRGDNEGWTPLHATVSCGVVSIAKYLIEHGANVAAVNNDGELPIDLADKDEMEDLLRQVIEAEGIDCAEARDYEERIMMADAKEWLNGGECRDVPHPKSGATALHVAAAKGYIGVMRVLIQAGADVNAQDYDGWTPLHAAAYWLQKKACSVLVENFCDMDITNYVGQTAVDITDSEVASLLEELKKKQAMMQRDNNDSNAILQKKGTSSQKRRTSITRMSGSDKSNLINKDASSERQLMEEGTNRVKTVELEIESQHDDDSDDVVTANQVEKKNKVNRDGSPRIPLSSEVNKTVPSGGPSSPPLTPTESDDSSVFIAKRPGSLRVRPGNGRGESPIKSSITSVGEKDKATSPTVGSNTSDVVLRRTQSFEADEKRVTRDENKPSIELPSTTASPTTTTSTVTTTTTTTASPTATSPVPTVQVRRSFVPPVRDEESETQRKAHAKRVRETRRSTQGVTLEEIKSAEQLVKKKNQQQLQQTTPQLNNDQPITLIPTTTTTNTVTATATITATSTPVDTEDVSVQERRPSWRLRVDNGDRNKFLLEDARNTPSTSPDNRASVRSISQPYLPPCWFLQSW